MRKLFTAFSLLLLTLTASAQTYTAGANLPAGTLWMLTSSGQAVPLTAGAAFSGIAQSAVSSGASVPVANAGTLNCLFENATAAGDLVIQGTSNPNECRDAGTASAAGISSSTAIYGVLGSSVSAGSLASVTLYSSVAYGTSGSGTVQLPFLGSANSGDLLAYANGKMVDSGYAPTGLGNGVLNYYGQALALSSANTTYFPASGNQIGSTTRTTVATAATSPAGASAGSVSNFSVCLSAAPGSGNSVTFTFLDGATAQSVTATISGSATCATDFTHSFQANVSDILSVEAVVTGTISGTPVVSFVYKFGTGGAANLPFTQSGSTYASTLTAYAQQRRSIADFGAVQDGSTDNTTAINAAFSWANSNSGSEIDVPCNGPNTEYLVRGVVYLPSYTMVRGGDPRGQNICSIYYNPATNPGTVVAAYNGIGVSSFQTEGVRWETGPAYPPNAVMVLARNNSGSGGASLLLSTGVDGYATQAILYSISQETSSYAYSNIVNRGGGAQYGFYTSGYDDLAVCNNTCGSGSSNLSINMTDMTFGFSGTNTYATYCIGDELGGGTGSHFFKNIYCDASTYAGSEGFHILSGNSSEGGPNDHLDIQDVRIEQSPIGVHFVLNSQTSISNVSISNLTWDPTTGTYAIYGDTGLTLNAATITGLISEGSNSTNNVSSVDTLTNSTWDTLGQQSYGETITVRTAAKANVFNMRQYASVVLPVSYQYQNVVVDSKGNYGLSACFQPTAACLVEEFVGGNTTSGAIGALGWATSSIGAAPAVNAGSGNSWGRPGYVNLQTAAVSGEGGSLYLGNANSGASSLGPIGANAGWISTWNTAISATTNVRYRVGFANGGSTSAVPTNGIYFCYDTVSGCGSLSSSATTWAACVDSSSTETCFNTGVTVTTSYFKFSLASSTAGSVSFWVGGSSLLTICSTCTDAATPPTAALAPEAIVVTNSTTQINASLEYFNFLVLGLNR